VQRAFRKRFIPILFGAAALPGSVLAQSAEQIDEVIVKGRYLSIDKLNAVKTPTPIIDIPQSLSLITDEQIAAQSFSSLGDILRYTPGLAVSQGEGHRDAIIIRGNQTTADFFIDGMRDDVQYFRPLYNVEQVEILRGANALLFGRGGGGGVINRVTKKPDLAERFVEGRAGVDSFGAFRFAGDANYSVSDDAAFRLNAYYEELNNHRDFFDGTRFALNPTFSMDLGPNTNVFLSYEYVDDDRVVDRGVPSVSVADGPDVPLDGFDETFFGSPDENLTTLEAHIVRARIEHMFSDQLRANVTTQYGDYDKLYQNLFPAGFDAPANLLTLDGYRDATERENLIVQANLIGELDTGPLGHTLLFGVEYGDQDTVNARDDNVFADSADDQITFAFTDPLAIPAFALSNRVRDRASQVEFTSVYFQDQVAVTDWLKVVGGVRYDRFDIDVVDNIEVADGTADGNDGFLGRVDNEVSPRGGIILKPMENLSFYASYSESFLPRSGDQFLTLDLTTEALAPESFENVEVGAKWNVRAGLALTAALFRLERESVTTVDPLDVGRTIVLDGTITEGFELQLVGSVTEKWSLNGGFSYLDGEVDGGSNDGNETRQTPEFMFSLWNRYQVTGKLGVGLGLTHQSAMFVREDNAVEVPSYTRVDAALYYDWSETLRFQANVENLFDTDYFPDAHSNDNISTGAPINVRFSVSTRF